MKKDKNKLLFPKTDYTFIFRATSSSKMGGMMMLLSATPEGWVQIPTILCFPQTEPPPSSDSKSKDHTAAVTCWSCTGERFNFPIKHRDFYSLQICCGRVRLQLGNSSGPQLLQSICTKRSGWVCIEEIWICIRRLKAFKRLRQSVLIWVS